VPDWKSGADHLAPPGTCSYTAVSSRAGTKAFYLFRRERHPRIRLRSGFLKPEMSFAFLKSGTADFAR